MTIQLSDDTRALADTLAIRTGELEIIAKSCNIETVGIELYPDEDAREQRAAIVDVQGDIIFMFEPDNFTFAYLEWCSQQDPVVIPF